MPAMAYDLNNRVALVTGGSRGLGAAISRQLGRCGASVAVNYITAQDRVTQVCQEITRAGGRALPFQADVRDEQQVEAMCRQIEQQLGPIDILVINATGQQPKASIEDLTWPIMLDQLEFFVKSPVILARQVVGGMKHRRWGRIIHIGSEIVERRSPHFSPCVAAKAAQLGLMRSWAMELAPHQITVNLIAPGWIPTDRHIHAAQHLIDNYTHQVPMGHMGEHDDVGHAAAFLASDAAKFITGQKLAVNGGNTLE
jgi:3-oxoacyl-[acyl-carrier protein] reductase